MLGGGGSINAQVFTRGVAEDYDSWVTDYGCEGWSADSEQVLRALGVEQPALRAVPRDPGPLGVSDLAAPHKLSAAFVKAGQEFGLPYNSDFNGASSTASASTRPPRRTAAGAAPPSAISARPQAAATSPSAQRHRHQVILMQRPGRRGPGDRSGSARTYSASREVFVSAGAFGSPSCCSFPASATRRICRRRHRDRHALVGVGKNLHDHCDLDIVYELTDTTAWTG